MEKNGSRLLDLKKDDIAIIKNKKNRFSKKILLITLSIIIFFGVVILITIGGLSKLMGNSVVNSNAMLEPVLKGDFNLDGQVNWDDYNLIARYNTSVLNSKGVSEFSEEQLRAGDINNDGIVYFYDQLFLEKFLNKEDIPYKDISKESCGYYYVFKSVVQVDGKTQISGCFQKNSNNYINNKKEGSYNIKYYEIHSDISNNTSFSLSENDGIVFNKVDYNKLINIENNIRDKLFNDSLHNRDNNYYSFEYSIIRLGYGNTGEALCYVDESHDLVGYTSEDKCQKNGFVKYKQNGIISKLVEPNHVVSINNILKLNKYRIAYNNSLYGSLTDDKDMIGINYVLSGENIKIANNKMSNSRASFLGWYAYNYDINGESRYYCYTNPSKTINWTNEETCNAFGYVLFQPGQIIKDIVDSGHKVYFHQKWSEDSYTIYFDSNGGNERMNSQLNRKTDADTLNKNLFKKSGYKFLGWYASHKVNGKDIKWYCYTSPSKSTADWVDNINTCGQFGRVLISDNARLSDYKNLVDETDIYLLAQWEKQKFTVKYNVNAGDGYGVMNDQKITYGVSTPMYANAFKRDGYDFIGWYAKRDDGTWYCYTNPGKSARAWTNAKTCGSYGYYLYKDKLKLSDTANPGKMVTMYAQWKTNRFTLKFDANGGTGSMADQKITYGVPTAISKNRFKKDGYAFIGWRAQRNDNKWYCYTSPSKMGTDWASRSTCDSNGYYLYKDGLKVKDTANPGGYTTMHAQWVINKYRVLYNANGGTGSMNEQQMTYGVSTAMNANKFKKSGYDFTGWYAKRDDGTWYCYTNPGRSARAWTKARSCSSYGYYLYKDKLKLSDTANPGGFVTMYAQWKTNQFTVRYNANGGYGNMTDQKITYGVSVPMYGNVFKRDGYDFTGWYAQRSDGTWYCYTNPGKSARAWTNASTCSSYGYYLYKDKLKLSDTAPKGGLVTMYAQWKTNQFTVRYNANGGYGNMTDQKITYGVSTALRANNFRKDGYKFVGWLAVRSDGYHYCYTSPSRTASAWSSSSTCSGLGHSLYKNQQKVSKTAGKGGLVTMYAQWKKN